MPAQIIDGNALAKEIKIAVKQAIEQRLSAGKRAPTLAVMLIGEDPASQIYVNRKTQACNEVGILSKSRTLPNDTTEQTISAQIIRWNQDPTIDGILLQLPLPKSINSKVLLETIAISKDVDGFHPYNAGRLCQQNPFIRACTPRGVMAMLAHTKIPLCGLHAVVVGASNLVGRPIALELLQQECTVTVAHGQTADLAAHIRMADIVIAAAGKPELIRGKWIKPNAIVIDVGITRLPNGRISGDVEFKSAIHSASWISPVPGGVGPMTVAMLMQNTLEQCEKHDPS